MSSTPRSTQQGVPLGQAVSRATIGASTCAGRRIPRARLRYQLTESKATTAVRCHGTRSGCRSGCPRLPEGHGVRAAPVSAYRAGGRQPRVETWDAIRARRNVRAYEDRAIPPADLDQILEAGRRWASAGEWPRWGLWGGHG